MKIIFICKKPKRIAPTPFSFLSNKPNQKILQTVSVMLQIIISGLTLSF